MNMCSYYHQSSEEEENGEKKSTESKMYGMHRKMKLFYMKSYQVEGPLGDKSCFNYNNLTGIYTQPSSNYDPRVLMFRLQGGIFREVRFQQMTVYTILVQCFLLSFYH